MHRIPRTATLLALLACSEDPIDALESYATDICACEGDEDCIEQVRVRWEAANVERLATSDLSDEDRTRGTSHIARALECTQ